MCTRTRAWVQISAPESAPSSAFLSFIVVDLPRRRRLSSRRDCGDGNIDMRIILCINVFHHRTADVAETNGHIIIYL